MLKELGNAATAIPYYAVYVPGQDKPIHFAPPNGTFLSSGAILDYLKEQGIDLSSSSKEVTETAAKTGRVATAQ